MVSQIQSCRSRQSHTSADESRRDDDEYTGLVLPACLPAEMLGSSAVRTSWEVSGVRFCERIVVATSKVVAIINDVANWSRTVMEKLMVRAK